MDRSSFEQMLLDALDANGDLWGRLKSRMDRSSFEKMVTKFFNGREQRDIDRVNYRKEVLGAFKPRLQGAKEKVDALFDAGVPVQEAVRRLRHPE